MISLAHLKFCVVFKTDVTLKRLHTVLLAAWDVIACSSKPGQWKHLKCGQRLWYWFNILKTQVKLFFTYGMVSLEGAICLTLQVSTHLHQLHVYVLFIQLPMTCKGLASVVGGSLKK